MANYEIPVSYLAKLFEERVRGEVRGQLQKVADEIVKEILDKVVKDACDTFRANIESWRSMDRLGEDIRITLVDKRS